MPEQMPEMTRAVLNAECVRLVRNHALGCKGVQAVSIVRATPPGSGPNWYVSQFIPELPPFAEKEAREVCLYLSERYALTGDS
jgi:hypothetical protein